LDFPISSTNNFYEIIGFNSGIYPTSPTTSSYNVIGSLTPNTTPVNSLIILCDLITNNVSAQSNILDTMSITSTLGSNINYNPNFEKWVSLNAGKYTNFLLTLVDQNFNTVEIKDLNMLISLIIETTEN